MLRQSVRSLFRTPVFSAAALLTLVIGVGAAAAMFTLVYGVVLAPLQFGDPSRLVSLDLRARSPESRRLQQPAAAYFLYASSARTLEDVAFYRTGNGNISGGDSEDPERVTATWITASAIPTLAVTPLLGRSFTPEEDQAGGPNAAILSESVWRSRFHADTGVIGKTLTVNAVPRRIVGVMRESFRFPTADTRIWLPSKIDRHSRTIGDFSWSAVARLKSDGSARAAERELDALFPRLAESNPHLESGTPTADWLEQVRPAPLVVPLRDEMTGGIARTLWLLGVAAALVLLVACANVANLMLIRADGRQLELAIRQALGASRFRILSHFLGEAALLAGAAGVIGLVAADSGVRAIVAFGPADIPRLAELHAGWATAAFTILVSTAAAFLLSVVAAIRARRSGIDMNLRDGGRTDTAGRARQRLRGAIAALQIAVALVVLASSALLLRTFRSLSRERPGFDASNVETLWIQLPLARYGRDSAAVSFFARLTQSVSALPGVRAAGVTTRLPLGSGEALQRSFQTEGDRRDVYLPSYVIDDGYLSAMRIPILAGRGFAPIGVQRDGEVLISRRAASALWQDSTGRAALGKRLAATPVGPSYSIVGVVGDVRYDDLALAPAAELYSPQALRIDSMAEPRARTVMGLVVRTSGSAGSVVPAVRQIVRQLDPTVPIFGVEPMTQVIRESTARLTLTLTLMSAAAAITLLLAAIGLYGVVAYTVALRTKEFGVRIALGADPRRLATSVTMRGLSFIAIGVVAGLFAFSATARFLRALLYGVTASDPVTLISVTLLLVLIAGVASWLPARRAAQVDPMEAIRAE